MSSPEFRSFQQQGYFKLRKSGVHNKVLYLTENSLITGSEICYTNLGGLVINNEPIRM